MSPDKDPGFLCCWPLQHEPISDGSHCTHSQCWNWRRLGGSSGRRRRADEEETAS